MQTIHIATCPICRKNWKAQSATEAEALEKVLSKAPMYGVLFKVNQTVWLYGQRECRVIEVLSGQCAKYRDGTYAHPLKFRIQEIAGQHRENVVSWRVLFHGNIATMAPVFKGRRTVHVTHDNYWKLFPEGIGFH
jgi:hypothetical protein